MYLVIPLYSLGKNYRRVVFILTVGSLCPFVLLVIHMHNDSHKTLLCKCSVLCALITMTLLSPKDERSICAQMLCSCVCASFGGACRFTKCVFAPPVWLGHWQDLLRLGQTLDWSNHCCRAKEKQLPPGK